MVAGAVQLIPLPILIKLTGIRTILPFYHAVSNDDLPHLKHLYPVISTSVFEKQLDYIVKHFRPASYDQLLTESKLKQPHFILSFDDGLRQFSDVVAPILIRKGIPATCFVNTAFIDNKAMFFRMKVSVMIEHLTTRTEAAVKEAIGLKCREIGIEYRHPVDLKKITETHIGIIDKLGHLIGIDFDSYISNHRPYMTTEQLISLRKQGFSIGAHSVNHPYFPMLTHEQQLKETLDSVLYVKQKFAMQDGLFSFPYTDYTIGKHFFDAIGKEVCLSFGTANIKRDSIPTHFQRIPMEIYGRENAQVLIKNQYLLHLGKNLLGKSKINRT